MQTLTRALAAALLCAGLAVPTHAQPVMRWLVQDAPPHFSYAGGKTPQSVADLGHGERDGFLRLLIGQLPQYRHEFVEASLPRFELMVRGGQTICSVLHKRVPERLASRYFTPMFPAPNSHQVQLVVRRDRLERFQSMGTPVTITGLLQTPSLKGLVARERSFGNTLDPLLKQAHGRALDTVVTTSNKTLLAMLRAGRMDYTLEYAEAVQQFLGDAAEDGKRDARREPDLLLLPIAELEAQDLAYASCTRNPEGREQIEAIDAAVRRLAQDPRRHVWKRQWLGESVPAAERARLIRFLDDRARRGPQVE